MSAGIAIGTLVSGTVAIAALFDPLGASLTLAADYDVPADAVTGDAQFVRGQFTQAQVAIAGLNMWSLVLLAAGMAAHAVMFAGLGALFIHLCAQVLRARPFSRSSTWLVATVSATLLTGSVIAFALKTISHFWIASQLNAEPVGSPFPLASTSDLLPLFVGLGLAAVSAAFEIGARLQRDTEGLV